MNCPEESEIRIARLEERLKASEIALTLAREYLIAWQATSNEWRKENIDQRNLYPTKDKLDSLIESLDSRLIILEKNIATGRGTSIAFGIIWAVTTTLVSIIIGTITLIINLK